MAGIVHHTKHSVMKIRRCGSVGVFIFSKKLSFNMWKTFEMQSNRSVEIKEPTQLNSQVTFPDNSLNQTIDLEK